MPGMGNVASRLLCRSVCLAACLTVGFSLRGDAAEETPPAFTPEQIEFFETRIRPLLVERCFNCHSEKAKKLQAGLSLDSRAATLRGGDSGPGAVVGKPDESLLIQAVRYESNEMPPDAKLPDQQIADLVRWVEMGAPWPGDTATNTPATEAAADWSKLRQSHWAWQRVIKPDVPSVEAAHRYWPRNEIDHFVLRRLSEVGLRPSPRAEPRVLARRVFLDLTGLPPTPEQIAAFESASAQDSQAALEKLIDQLLDSPHYGERWGRHWLDVARYSDGYGGFLDNNQNTQAWHYRDWVVNALNADMPYDQFVRLQIAGDLIGESKEDAVATGFFALGPTYRSDGGDPDSVAQAKSETLDDRVDTLSRGFLGMTVACARCHDHKFDPVRQVDYYGLAGVFNNSTTREFPLAPDDDVKRYNDRQQAIRDFDQQIKKLQKAARDEKREPTEGEKQQLDRMNAELKQLRETAPPKYDFAHALVDSGSGDMQVAIRGNLRKPGADAPRRFLRVLSEGEPPRYSLGSGRIELAESIADPDNPLTARVLVNRVWMHHFGQALVRSPSNFGTLGQKPTHPELLDLLAATFVENGWSLKSLHRQIILSATYQQSSRSRSDAFAVDGDNRFVWRMNPHRMDAETWRDSLLSVTGELDTTFGGPPVDNLVASKRRTFYAKVSRNGDQFRSDEFLRLFDFPLMRATVAKRPMSIVPQQFLFMMNSDFMIGRARSLAQRLNGKVDSADGQIDLAYQLLYGRLPSDEERQIGHQFLAGDRSDNETPTGELSRRVLYAQTLLSSNEFMFIR